MPRRFAEYYDHIFVDKYYDKDINDFVHLAARPDLANLRVLEIGAGTGNQSLRLSKLCARVTAVETDPDFAAVLEAKIAAVKAVNITLISKSIDHLPNVSFDAA